MALTSRTALVALLVATPSGVVSAQSQSTSLVSVDSAGKQGDAVSFLPSISSDGRLIAFTSIADNLAPLDSNGTKDIFVHDTLTGATTLVSVTPIGTAGNSQSDLPRIASGGRYVAFLSADSDLVTLDSNGLGDVFVRDLQAGATTLVSSANGGSNGNSGVEGVAISGDGRFVAFTSFASNLVSGDGNNFEDVFVADLGSGTIERVSVDSSGNEGDQRSVWPSISDDGRFVTFVSLADNLVANDGNATFDVFLHDRASGATTCLSVDSTGTPGDLGTQPDVTTLSGDGRYALFSSASDNLVAGDTNGQIDVFLCDLQLGTTERVNLDSSGAQAQGSFSGGATISADGRTVAFWSQATNLVPGDTNSLVDVFTRDRTLGRTRRVSVDSSGTQADGASSFTNESLAAISADGRFVAFESLADNLVAGDSNTSDDIFVHGPFLTLEAGPSPVSAGATLTFDAWGGEASGASMLVVSSVNGTSFFIPVLLSTFDASGRFTFGVTVPNGLAGLTIGFELVGIQPNGKVGLSNSALVLFQ